MNFKELKKNGWNNVKKNIGGMVGVTTVYLLMYAVFTLGILGKGVGIIGAYLTPALAIVYILCLKMLKDFKGKGVPKYRYVDISLAQIWNSIKYTLWIALFSLPMVILIFIALIPLIFKILNSVYMGDPYYLLNDFSFSINLLIIVYIVGIVYCIILNLMFSLTPYIIMERKNHDTVRDLMTEAHKLIKGHMWNYFLFKLSFILWYILGIITLGIGFLWITPYIEMCKIEYYYKLKEIKGNKCKVVEDDFIVDVTKE
ncbi:DUF975 family protein [Clostridium tarantellae]|uniref:DUF975 family protein n=1 Tax=Clostridium tarantellae TaxID=39493 RepID=A0A6I1MNA6_9CLOT|nr:DUF975 family protein [Clostridium tarantellae]MPQ43597.1 DUF975 family protein [Clostridium tarantellae]